MASNQATPAPAPTPEQVLAAIDRAERHSHPASRPGVVRSQIAAHLGLPHSAWTTRRTRPALEALETDHLIEKLHDRHPTLWEMTPKGRRRLAALRQAGSPAIRLHESPQRQRWRKAHEAAQEQIGELREQVRAQLAEADQLLALERPDSDAWLETAKRLRDACWRLGSATHCLYEWTEPDDAQADIDPGEREAEPPAKRALRAGRRNVRLWNTS